MAPATKMAPERTDENGAKNELAPRPPVPTGPLATLIKYCQDPDTQKRLREMLGQRAGAFSNSIINVVKNSRQLQDIAVKNAASIMSAAMIAASVNLPIDPALGFAAIVPYGGKNPAAQFQLMYKGLIQLAIRSGQYERIHDTEIYRDEIESYNPITGEIKFTDPATWKMRSEGKIADVAGFYTFFRLKTGFEASKYISFEQAMAHGKRFSRAYQYDVAEKKKASLWSTDPIAMGRKTCIKMLIGKYGILSIEMQDAFVADGEDFTGEPQHVDATVLEGPEVGGVEGLKGRMLTEPTTETMNPVVPPDEPVSDPSSPPAEEPPAEEFTDPTPEQVAAAIEKSGPVPIQGRCANKKCRTKGKARLYGDGTCEICCEPLEAV